MRFEFENGRKGMCRLRLFRNLPFQDARAELRLQLRVNAQSRCRDWSKRDAVHCVWFNTDFTSANQFPFVASFVEKPSRNWNAAFAHAGLFTPVNTARRNFPGGAKVKLHPLARTHVRPPG